MEEMPRSEAGPVESEQFKERLSVDYQHIRDTALTMIEHRIDLMKTVLGPNDPEIARCEEAKRILSEDQFVLDHAKNNNWEQFRGLTEDGEETDKKLAEGLVTSFLPLH